MPPAAAPPPAAPKPPAAPPVQQHERERTAPTAPPPNNLKGEPAPHAAPPEQSPPPSNSLKGAPTPHAAPQTQTPPPNSPKGAAPEPQVAPKTQTPPAPNGMKGTPAPQAAPQTQTAPPPNGVKGAPAPQATPQTQTTPPPSGLKGTPAPQAAPQTQTPPTPNGVKGTTAPQAAPQTQTTPAPNSLKGQAATGAAPVVERRPPPTVTTPLPAPPPPAQGMKPLAAGAAEQGPRRLDEFRGERREVQEGGRTVITEPGRVIIRDPGGESFIRHSEVERFRYGARDIQTERVGNDTRTIVVRPDGTQIINVIGSDGQLLRRVRRDQQGREIVIIDNSYRDPRAVGGFYVDLPPPVIRIPYDHYIVDAEDAPPDLIYETMEAPPVERIARRYSLDEIRYSPSVRQLMPSIDLNTITFETGSWAIPPDQAARLQVIADGLNRAIQRNPREVFLIEGHTDAVGNDVDNLSLSDRRAESAAELLTQQFGVPAENLTSQGYGSQYRKEQTDGPSRVNRRVTVRRITPLLNGGTASLPPPPPGVAPPR